MSGVATTSGAAARIRAAARAVDREPWKFAVSVVVAVRIAFFLVALGAQWLLSSQRGPLDEGPLEIWARWDALGHFFPIAERGYDADPDGTAFFPLYPLLLRVISALGPSLVISGLIISTVACTVAFAYLYRLAEHDLGAGAGRRAVLYLALFPTAVFLVAPYSESVFLAGAIAAFYYARRGDWQHTGVPAAVAMGARLAGLFLLFGLACEFLRQRQFTKQRLVSAGGSLLIGVLPLLAYMAWQGVAMNNPWQFLTDQKEGWYREFTNPVQAFRTTWDSWNSDNDANWLFAWRFEIVAAAAGVFLTGVAVVRREWGYAGYIGTTMAAMMTSTWYFSIPRILLSLFPAVLFLAAATLDDERRHELALLVLGPLCALGVVVYTRGAWFY